MTRNRSDGPEALALSRGWPSWGASVLTHLAAFFLLALGSIAPRLLGEPPPRLVGVPFDPRVSEPGSDVPLAVLSEPVASEPDRVMELVPPSLPSRIDAGSRRMGAMLVDSGRAAGLGRSAAEGNSATGSARVFSPFDRLLPSQPARAIRGAGRLPGEITSATDSIDEALDELAREILRHLEERPVTVIWLFDESYSMRDDQQAVRERFDRVSESLKAHLGGDRRAAARLNHVVVGFGLDLEYVLAKPTNDIDRIGRAIDRLSLDRSGIENTMAALRRVISDYGRTLSRDRKILIVLATDESGDDGNDLERTLRLALEREVTLYVLGRQSLFGYDWARMKFIHPETGDAYWGLIRRGPESAYPETLQWDGLHARRDEQPAGFGTFELARLVRETGGLYFALPSEETLGVRRGQRVYPMKTLQAYVPDYGSREEYRKKRSASELRKTLAEIIDQTRGDDYPTHFPVEPTALGRAIAQAVPLARHRLELLRTAEARLEQVRPLRDREPERRWQAHYDLILAQIVTYEIQAYEYLACLDEMVALANQGALRPNRMPVPGQLAVDWVLDHSQRMKAPRAETESKMAEAEALLRHVIALHPETPWADLAQDELDRGFGVERIEWDHHPRYNDRASVVPKY